MTTALAEAPRLPSKDDFPHGAVIIPCHDLARYHQFTYDLIHFDVPDGTYSLMQRSASVVQNMNMGVEQMLATDAAWAWIIGDDHSFNRDVVLQLLKHDVDIVVPLCTKRGPPFSLVLFDKDCGEDEHGRRLYNTVQFDELPTGGGLFEVAAAGSAGMLIKRHVLEAMEAPWFRNSDGITVNEDLEFCRRARQAGFKIMVDPATQIGHFAMLTAWPKFVNGVWGLVLDLDHGAQMFIPGGVKPDADEDQVKIGQLRRA